MSLWKSAADRLVDAVKERKPGAVRLLLQSEPMYQYGVDRALRLAASCGFTEGVKLLLGQGAKLQMQEGAALWLAAKGGHSETLDVLLKASENMILTKANDLALFWAAIEGHAGTVKVLLAHRPNRPAAEEAMTWASLEGHTEVVDVLQMWIAGTTAAPAPYRSEERKCNAFGSRQPWWMRPLR